MGAYADLSRPALTTQSHTVHFQTLGLSTGLSHQLIETYPFITHPTAAQSRMIPAVLARNDVLLRAHTGSGKSFGLLLALMAKPRVTFSKETEARSTTGTASLIVVPTNELAQQYIAWAKMLLPSTTATSLDSVIQVVVRGNQQLTPEQQVNKLIDRPPHILIATPRRALEILSQPQGSNILGLQTLQTLVLDEADSLLDLPGRFPSAKMVWNNMVHPPPGLTFLNEVMKIRGTFSGGQVVPSAGLEPSAGKRGDELRPPEKYRRTQHLANERLQAKGQGWLTPPKILKRYERPLQVVACSATTNAVLRHFLGAKTGWVRIGIREQEQDELTFGRRPLRGRSQGVTGQWIDLTGMSGMTGLRSKGDQVDVDSSASAGKAMPVELAHVCVIVDEGLPPSRTQQGTDDLGLLPAMRNMSQKRIRRSLQPPSGSSKSKRREEQEDEEEKDAVAARALELQEQNIVRSFQLPPSEVDTTMLESLAYTFALEGVSRALVFIPPQWSLRSTVTHLTELGMPVVPLEELQNSTSSAAKADDSPKVSVIQSTSGRGLDIPHLSHVFILGMEAVRDSVQYAHLAGRTSRIGRDSKLNQERKAGTVVTLVRGLTLEDARRNEEIALRHRNRTMGKVNTTGESLEEGKKRSSSKEKGQVLAGRGEQTTPKRLLISSGEKKMSTIYARLGVRPGRIELKGINEVDEEEDVDVDEDGHPDGGSAL